MFVKISDINIILMLFYDQEEGAISKMATYMKSTKRKHSIFN